MREHDKVERPDHPICINTGCDMPCNDGSASHVRLEQASIRDIFHVQYSSVTIELLDNRGRMQ